MLLRRVLPRQLNRRFPLAALLASAPTEVTANLTATLDAAILTGAGAVAVTGAVTATLGAATLTANATGATGGSLTVTLAVATLSATGSAAVVGTLTKTLAAATLTSAGSAGVTGALTATLAAATLSAKGLHMAGATIGGVLTVDPTNGRYFRNASGIVLLSGFHTWYEFQDGGTSYPPTAFDYADWLDYLDARGVNLHKLWVMETARQWADADAYFYPMPYQRTGPGNAADGRPKFDLTLYEAAYFDRLRERAILAGNRGHYVVVQLFQGWQVESKGYGFTPYAYHPYNAGNNVNGIDGDTDNDGAGEETRVTTFTAVYDLQKAYVAKVLDTLNDLDNVIYEISNEDTSNSVAWQHDLIDYIHTYEAGKPKQHPVGMTVIFPSGSDSDLAASNAEWISPNNGNSLAPGTADGSQVVLFDTDHIVGLTTEYKWIWQSFTRGYNPAFMDVYDGALYGVDQRADAAHEKIRYNLGYALTLAAGLDLAGMTPQNSLSSTGYALAKTTGAAQIVAYQHTSGSFTVNLGGLAGTFSVTWLRPLNGATQAGSNISGGATRTLTPPWAGEDAVAVIELAGSNGDLTSTLAGATLSAAGSAAVVATVTATLSAATVTGAAVVLVQATATVTLAGVTLTSAGAAAVTGASTVTLAAATISATATVGNGVSGALDVTLAAATLAGTGAVQVQAAAVVTPAAATLDAAGVAAVVADLTSTLDATTLTAFGGSGASAALVVTLDGATLNATASAPVAGGLDTALGAALLDATAGASVVGVLTSTLAGATLAAGVGMLVAGTLDATLGAATLTSAAYSEEPPDVTGDLTVTLSAATLVATAVIAFVATLGRVTGSGGAGMVRGPKSTSTIGV